MKSRPISLQRRLGVGLTLGLVVLWLTITLLIAAMLTKTLNKALDSSLEEVAQRMLSLAVVEILNRETPDLLQQVVALHPHDEYITYLVRSADGTPLLQSHAVDAAIFPAKPQLGLRTRATHRLYGASAVSGTIFIEVAEPLASRNQALRQSLKLLLLPLIFLIPLSLLGIWLFVGYSLGGVKTYRDALEARGANDLTPVAANNLPTEILPIAEAVNHLLARLRFTLEAERSFTANSAHELRTPLAAALAQAQRLRHKVPDGSLKERAIRIEKSLGELANLSEKLLQLAKADLGGFLVEAPYDLGQILGYLLGELSLEAKARVKLFLPEAKPVTSLVDPDALAILMRNLIENALKHGAANQPVEVHLTIEGVLRVVNAGPIVPAEDMQHLTERFVRSKTLASGSGLGLAIAQTIALGVGTKLVLYSPAKGREDGFEVSLKLP